MKVLRYFVVAASLAAALHSSPASSAPWPERIVRIVLPAAAGSSIDLAARVFADRLSERWQRAIVVDNRAGADGILAVQELMRAYDGHTLLFAFPGIVTVVPLLHADVPYDPASDLVPIASVAQDYLAVVVSTKLPAESLDQLVATARSRPGELNWAAAPGAPYLTFLEFQRRARIDLAYVPYRSSSLALPDLIAGEIQVAVTPLASALALARDRKLKLLAVSTMQRSPTAPEIPTVGEAGHPELTVEAPLGLFGPKGMSHGLRTRIAADVAAVAHEPEVRARLETAGLLAHASTPDEYAAVLAEQRTRWAALARALGVSAQ